MINVKEIKSLPSPLLHIRDAFQVSWANQHRSLLLRKREIDRSETGAKSLVRGHGTVIKYECFHTSSSVSDKVRTPKRLTLNSLRD